ncbi:hypothetical protein AB0395_46175 [Streptosporangium sp. NPDC051023]|uniref:hypothetical protein n=1 Tax=Streptosporangium sp. NPDC051023 TaxID=3155410 RepID=UPI0034500576
MLAESTLTEAWEHQVAACLTVMCAEPNGVAAGWDIAAMVERFLGENSAPGYAVFRARLGLTVATLADGTDPDAAGRVLAQVGAEAIEAGDGYAARDVLGYRVHRTGLTNVQCEALSGLVIASALGPGKCRSHCWIRSSIPRRSQKALAAPMGEARNSGAGTDGLH